MGRTSAKLLAGIFGIPEASEAEVPKRSKLRLKPRRVKPNRIWFSDPGVIVQLCSVAIPSARVNVFPMIAVVMAPLPSGSGATGLESSRK